MSNPPYVTGTFVCNTSSVTSSYITAAAAMPYIPSTFFSGYQASPKLTQYENDVEFNGDVKIKGHSLAKILETIEKRLSILHPDPKKLEDYEALRIAYENYKLIEALIYSDKDNKND